MSAPTWPQFAAVVGAQPTFAPLIAKHTNEVHINDFKSLGDFELLPLGSADGGQDCKLAFDAAIAQISNAGAKGKRLVQDAGIYWCSALETIIGGQDNWAWDGGVPKSSFLKLKASSPYSLVRVASAPGDIDAKSVTVRNVGFDGNRQNQTDDVALYGIYVGFADTASADPAWRFYDCNFVFNSRGGLYLNGRGDHRVFFCNASQNGRWGIHVGKVFDSKFGYNILAANGQEGFYAETLAGCTLVGNKSYFIGYNTYGTISQAATSAGMKERRLKGSGYQIDYAFRVEMIANESEDTLGNGITVGRAEHLNIVDHIFNNIGSQGRDYYEGNQYSNLTQPRLEITNPDSGVYAIEFTGGRMGGIKVTGQIWGSSPSAERYGQWVRGAVKFNSAGSRPQSKRQLPIDIDIRGGYPANHGQADALFTDDPNGRKVRIQLSSAIWQSGNTVRLTGPYMSGIGRQMGSKVMIPGLSGTPSGLVGGPYTITGQNNGLTYLDITIPSVSNNASDFTGTMYVDVLTYQMWQGPFAIELGNYNEYWDNLRLRWNGADVGPGADMHVKDIFNGKVNPSAGRIGFTTRPRQTRTITGVAKQGLDTRFTLDAITTVAQGRNMPVSISGLAASVLNGVWNGGVISAGSGYIDVLIDDNVNGLNDGTGLSGTALLPYDSSLTTQDGNLDHSEIILYGENINPSNKVVIKFHKFREADGSVSTTKELWITGTGQETTIVWDGGAWFIKPSKKRRVVANPTGDIQTYHYRTQVVRITGASDASATLSAGLYEGQEYEVVVHQGSTGKLNLTVADLFSGSAITSLADGRHLYRWEKWDGTTLKWKKVA